MSWPTARAALLTALRTLNETVIVAPPLVLDDYEPRIAVPPPPRLTERRPGGVRNTSYEQRISLISRASTDNKPAGNDAAAIRLDDLAESVNDVLDQNLQLGGAAVSVSAPEWEELDIQQYPNSTGLLVFVMDCTITIEVEVITNFTP